MKRGALLSVVLLMLFACSAEDESVPCIEANSSTPVPVHTRATPLRAHYALSRPSFSSSVFTDLYRVEIAIRFEAVGGTDPAALPAYRALFERCLAVNEPFFRGPYGEQLQIVVTNGPDATVVQVTKDSAARGDHKLWLADWTCAPMLHETFHHVGLVDEYAEVEKFPSRVIGPADSLMSNPVLGLSAGVPVRSWHECRCSTPECSRQLPQWQSERRMDCPSGATHVAYTTSYPHWRLAELDYMADEENFLRGGARDSYRYINVSHPARNSLLYPAQFEAIVRPGCGTSSRYAACASRAYAPNDVGPAPDFCSGVDWLL